VRTNPDLSVKIPEIGRKVGSKHSKRGRYAEKKANSGDCHDQQLVNTLLPRDSLGGGWESKKFPVFGAMVYLISIAIGGCHYFQ